PFALPQAGRDQGRAVNRDKFGRFAPGQSGNLAGRPRGSRGKLGEIFITQLYADWLEHGETVIAEVRTQKPEVLSQGGGVVTAETARDRGRDVRWTYRRATLCSP